MTPSGWALGAAGPALLASGWLLGYPELLALGVASLACLAVALSAVARPPRVDVMHRLERERVQRGADAGLVIFARNPRRRRIRGFLVEEPIGDATAAVMMPTLGAGESKTTTLPLPTDRRGLFEVGPAAVVRCDLLGLARVQRLHDRRLRLWVYPRTCALEAIPAGLARDVEGPTSDNSPEGAITFHALREYTLGDDLRRVHWRSSARTGVLMVRQYVDTSRPEYTLALDTSAPAHTDSSFEAAVEAAASVVTACSRKNFPVRLDTGATDGTADLRGALPYERALEQLAVAERLKDVTTGALLDRVRSGGPASVLVMFGGRLEEGDVTALTSLRPMFKWIVVASFAPGGSSAERTLPRGISSITAATAEDFALGWNHLRR